MAKPAMLEAQPDDVVSLAQLETAAAELGIDLGGDAASLTEQARINLDAGEQLARASAERRYMAGLQLLAAREQYMCTGAHGGVPPGGNSDVHPGGNSDVHPGAHGWLEHLESIGIDRFRAAEFCRIAAKLAQLSAPARRELLGIGKKKQLAITALDIESIEAAHVSGDLAALAGKPKAEIIAYAQRCRDESASKDHLIRGYEQQIAQLKREFRVPASRLAPQYGAYRDETVYLTEQVQAQVAHITGEGRKLLMDPAWRQSEDSADKAAAAAAAAQTLRGAVASALAFADELEQLYGTGIVGGQPPGMRYTVEQAEYLAAIRKSALEVADEERRQARVRAMDRNGVRGIRPGSKKGGK